MQINETHHARQRQRQRHIHHDLIQLVLREGEPLPRNPDRLLLSRRRVQQLRAQGQIAPRLAERAEKAAPLVCVVDGATLVTAFRASRRINRGR